MTTAPVRPGTWYRAVWRWHFYAGLFCMPFVLWLSVTGGIYLFKPQIEAWLDRPYAALPIDGPLASPAAQAQAAVDTVPGSMLHRFILSPRIDQATQVVVGRGAEEVRVYVHPQTLAVLQHVVEEQRPMAVLFRLHGELMAGRWGSLLVELAASWAILMLLTGIYLWWPRSAQGLGGVLVPRVGRGSRVFWRDIHASIGAWISLLALGLILTGLPWAKNWGDYFRDIRTITGQVQGPQDWSSGSAAERAARVKLDAGARAMMGEHAEHGGMTMAHMHGGLRALDAVVPAAEALQFAAPVEISPPTTPDGGWLVKSNAANRPQRANARLSNNGRLLWREDFAQRHWIDRVVGYGIAAHEGALFGRINLVISLLTVIGLSMIAVSGAVMWWRRRPSGILGAPPVGDRAPHRWALVGVVIALGFVVPLFGISLAIVALAELAWLRRSRMARWLGLRGVVRG